MKTDAMTFPTIHSNGTSATRLESDYCATWAALRQAETSFENIEFNARDYYVQGDKAFTQAREQRYAMFRKLREVTEYIEAHAEHIANTQ